MSPTKTQKARPRAQLEPAWQEWLTTNVQRGCTPSSLIAAMVEKRIEFDLARRAVRSAFDEFRPGEHHDWPAETQAEPATVSAAAISSSTAAPEPAYQPEPSRLPSGNFLRAGGKRMRVLLRLERPEIVLLEDVLSSAECEEMIRLAEEKLDRSTTVDPQTGEHKVIEARTSYGTYFTPRENPFIASIDERLADLVRWPVEKSEGLQILRYQKGGEYKPHFDYFPPSDPGSSVHFKQGGQRIGTLVLYLSDVRDGGETIFPEVSLSVAPRRGNAVYFSYFNSRGQVDPLTLHGGAPVRQGEKWIATKWLRERPRG